MYYLATLFHFLENKTNVANQPSQASDHKGNPIEEKDPPDPNCLPHPRLMFVMLRVV